MKIMECYIFVVLAIVIYIFVQYHHMKMGYGWLRMCYKNTKKILVSIKNIFFDDDESLKKTYGEKREQYNSLSKERQDKLKELRAVKRAEIKTRPIVHTVGIGIIAVMFRFFDKYLHGGLCVELVLLIMFILWCVVMIYAVWKQAKSIVIISAIDDALEALARKDKYEN